MNRELNFRIRAGDKFIYTGDLNELKTLFIDLKKENSLITWQQCSEIKDRKGNLIYEGDILKYSLGTINYIYTVKFGAYRYPSIMDKNAGTGFYLDVIGDKNFYPTSLHDGMTRAFEIIGNTFDNPDMLSKDNLVLTS